MARCSQHLQDHRGSAISAFFLSEHAHCGGCKGLKEHSIDFGILRKSAVVAPLKFHSIGQIGYALFAPAAWAKEKEDATTLLRQRPVAVSAGGEFNKRFRECCEKAKLTPNLRFSCASFTQVAELVRTGNAVALLPEMAEPSLRESGVRRFDFAPMRTYRREIGIVWHPRLVSIRPARASARAWTDTGQTMRRSDSRSDRR